MTTQWISYWALVDDDLLAFCCCLLGIIIDLAFRLVLYNTLFYQIGKTPLFYIFV